MTVPPARWVGTCVFERHPAAIDRHTASTSHPADGFDGITTWSPHLLGSEGESPTAAAEPEFIASPEPPSGYRAPPVPVRPADPLPRPDLGLPPLEPGLPTHAALDQTPLEHGAVTPALDLPPTLDTVPPEPAEAPVAADPPSLRDPFMVPQRSPQPAPAVAPARGSPLEWPGSSPLRRASPPDDGAPSSWDTEALLAGRRGRPWPNQRPRFAKGAVLALAGAACVAGLILAGFHYGPALFGSGQSVTAVFNAPMMVVRSAATGRVLTVAATATQIVDPKSPLLTIHTDDGGPDRPVLAGVHGMVRSVETVPGAALVAGAPLVRLQDCDRAFLTIPPGTKLQAGQTVQVKLPDQKPFAGKIRASAGVMEPPDSLVVGIDPGTMTASCPVGRSATVTPPTS